MRTIFTSHIIRASTRLAALALSISVLLASIVPAHADTCDEDERLGDDEVYRLATQIDELSIPRLLARLEPLDRCDNLQRLAAGIDPEFYGNRRVLAAILLVTTVGRDPSRARTPDLVRASELLDQLPFRHDREHLMTYIADKLSVVPDNEPIFAFLSGPTPVGVVSVLAGSVEATGAKRVSPGPWAPPGKQPIPFYIGNRAHEMIAKYYRDAQSSSRVESNSTPIATILQRLAKSGLGPAENEQVLALGPLAMRPDIVNLSTQEIYEIKPAGREAEALAAVRVYQAAFTSAGVSMRPGRAGAPGTVGVVPAPAGHYRFWSTIDGVIAYRYHRGAYVPALEPETRTERTPGVATIPIAERRARARREPAGGFWDKMSRATGLTGGALVVYLILSEGSRVIPARNALPIP